jgi:hypothetical protein
MKIKSSTIDYTESAKLRYREHLTAYVLGALEMERPGRAAVRLCADLPA